MTLFPPPDLDRRAFVALVAAGAGSSLAAGVLSAQIQPGTAKLATTTIREAARLAGLDWTDAECEEVGDALSSFAKHAEKIDKSALTNASALPLHFDPRPPGIAVPVVRRSFRPPPTPRVARPRNLEDVAFWSIPRRTAIMQEVASVMAAVDALLFTTLSLDSRTSINPVMSLTGHPSIAVPIGFTGAGSPKAVMFSGQLYREGELLMLARAVERGAAGAPRYPPGFGPLVG